MKVKDKKQLILSSVAGILIITGYFNFQNVEKNNNLAKINEENIGDVQLVNSEALIMENEIENIMEKARHTFGFAPEDYEIKKIASTLASCDKDTQSILVNPYIVMYSREIVEYVVFHQFCHLKYKTHSKKFYDMLKKYVPNYETLARQLPNLKY